MTQFKDIELLYNQLLNLTVEIETLISEEDYSSADEKVHFREKLFKRILNAKKTAELTLDEEECLRKIELRIKVSHEKNIELLLKLKEILDKEIKNTNQKQKINSAYSASINEDNGTFVDYSE